MTSKELIEKIKHIGIEEWRLAIEKIEKDLEVLDIFKRVFNYKSIQKFIEDMSKEEWIKIKEWLENE